MTADTAAVERRTSAALAVRDLAVRYGRAVAVEHISLTVGTGECLAVVGANGAGKSTLGKAVSGLVPLAGGAVEYGGRPVGRDAVRAGIVYVPEGRMVFPQLTVEENLKVGGFVRRRRDDWREQRDAMYALVPRLADRSSLRAGLLSGGEQQLLAIARALMARPRLLVLDEPSLGLSPMAIGTVTRFLDELRAETDLSILLLEQNTAFAARLADRGMVAKLGRIDRDDLSQADLAEISVFQG
ncbi:MULTISPECIES: ABC transporter ATP-binding protein [unclassified Nocardioides]|uniref:ABC transporter ATP-binding protein n=1 Tax=unclassified Nocardioides TaxID=2615069 RepID=UPI000056F312|nr:MULTISPECIES: ABC transporter ATP-binding protein [unclassified Nocardioides]ABL83609.1 amino acid/amide ABC transporter ATP-binding protein 2, HAAT family [Nocardioides sp. JS614]MBI2242409.1 ABC transporter ATP-binding protein [Nocardioides sp.]